jgi:hypothetical protein
MYLFIFHRSFNISFNRKELFLHYHFVRPQNFNFFYQMLSIPNESFFYQLYNIYCLIFFGFQNYHHSTFFY